MPLSLLRALDFSFFVAFIVRLFCAVMIFRTLSFSLSLRLYYDIMQLWFSERLGAIQLQKSVAHFQRSFKENIQIPKTNSKKKKNWKKSSYSTENSSFTFIPTLLKIHFYCFQHFFVFVLYSANFQNVYSTILLFMLF